MGVPMPAGCYVHIEKMVRQIAQDFTSDPSTIAHQYGPAAANVPQVVTTPPTSAPPSSGHGFLARFFGAR